jgi:hypothetical protein
MLRMNNLWGAGLCLAAAALLVLLCGNLPTERVYNLDLANPGIGDTYLIPHRSEPDRCFVVARRDATMRRSDDNQPGRKWQCYRMAGEADGSPSWLVRSKRKGKGAVLLVPVSDVRDWSYPFLYAFVREHRSELELPKVEWTQLFVNRLYEGLYLRVSLPFDLRKKDGGSGVLREVISVEGAGLSVINTRFEEVRASFNEAIAVAVPPVLSPQPGALVWLALANDAPEVSFLMSPTPPHSLRLLPLPISLPRLYALHSGRDPVRFEDERYRGWETGWKPRGSAARQPFASAEAAAMKAAFDVYRSSFLRALSVDGQRNERRELHEGSLPARQRATQSLGMPLVGTL